MTAPQTQPIGHDRAEAVVRKVWRTGLYFEHDTQIGLELEIAVSGGPPYVVEALHVISLLTATQFQPGQRLGVVVDPNGKANLIPQPGNRLQQVRAVGPNNSGLPPAGVVGSTLVQPFPNPPDGQPIGNV